MRQTADLTGKRFGNLTVLAKTGERQDRYWAWRCKCDCGKEIVVNTKRLTRGTVTHCGCAKKSKAAAGPVPEDLTGRRYGKLTVLRLDKPLAGGKTSWLCQCDCGNQCVVTGYSLHHKKRKSCGCLHREWETGEALDLTGQVFGRLTAQEQTPQTDRRGSPLWRCRCECGNEILVSQESLTHGKHSSCGCVRQEQQETLHENLTFVENTCVEVLERRKSRSDNTSGFRGVSQGPNGKWLVTIGLQGKRYYVGLYSGFDDAVKARMHMEEALHTGFVTAYQRWQAMADENAAWAKANPFYFRVEKRSGEFYIDTVFEQSVVSAL